ncbi:MAG: copper chaperone PCu(A)C [Yoonia sp.]|uniref:copper chaperone PCu(A)C n=1 Tax=Yoonia sp. TaxID=2212373 RepID=UPI00273F59B0|nr:copper chaperone PCu(A)C [Yoonia sp.]MDP5084295.1 copper chaperone PCu(A)C [Yoonia sp.]
MNRTPLAVLALLTLSSAAWAEDTLSISQVIAFETPSTAMSGGGFMQITNTGATDDTLISVIADFPRVEIHTTEFTDGIARMKHIDGIPVPAGETVTLAPGGLHVMFMGLNGDPLEIGETIPATLVFAQAGEIPVTFEVVARDMAAHSN